MSIFIGVDAEISRVKVSMVMVSTVGTAVVVE